MFWDETLELCRYRGDPTHLAIIRASDGKIANDAVVHAVSTL